MAGQRVTRDLYLQVGGNVTGLQTASKAGKTALLELGSAAIDVQATVEKAFAEMASDAPTSARALEQSYTKTFNAIRANAQAALSAPTQGGALQILDAGAAERSASAAETQATALRQVATAAAMVAQRAGEAGEAERVLAVAAAANAQQAEQEATALRSQANVLGMVKGELETMGVVQRTAVTRNEQHRQSVMMAGQQLQDFSVQVVSGQSVVTAFSQQIGQMAFAVQGMGGKLEGVANFLTSEWGIAATVALTVLAPLVSKVIEHSDALGDETDKLKDNAEKAAIADRAKQAFLQTEAGAIDDVRLLTEEIKKQNEALLTNAERLNIRAKQRLELLQGTRDDVAKELADARSATSAPPTSGGVAGTGTYIQGDAERKVIELETRLKNIDTAIAKANAARLETQKDLAGDAATRAVDQVAQIRHRYEGADGLLEQAKKQATAEETINGTLTRRLTLLKQQQKIETDAAQKAMRDAKATPSTAIESSVGDMTALLKTVLPGVRITSTTGGQHVTGSDHYKSRAIDFVPAGGMGSMTKADVREALSSAGVRIRRNGAGIEQLFGPGDPGHSNHFHVAWEGGVKSTDELARASDQRQRQAEAAEQKRLRDEEAYAQLRMRAEEQALDLRRAQVTDIAAAADLDVRAVQIERQRLDSAADAGVAQKRWSQAKADGLKTLYAENEQLKVAAIRDAEAQRLQDQQLSVTRDMLAASSTLLQIQGDLALTAKDRKRIALQLLANDEAAQRAQAVRLIGSDNPDDWRKGEDILQQVDAEHSGRVEQVNRQNADPMEVYRQRMTAATADINGSLQGVEVHALENIEDGLLGIVDGTESVASAFKRMAASIIADLARIAIEKAIVGAIGKATFFGLATGGKVANVPGYASGGLPFLDQGIIRGMGTGTSDSILAMVDGRKPIRVSNGEAIVNERGVRKHWALIDAINHDRLPMFASGGLPGNVSLPRLPDIDRAAREIGGSGGRFALDARVKVEASPLLMASVEETTVRTVGAAADPIMSGAEARTMARLRRPSLPGAPG